MLVSRVDRLHQGLAAVSMCLEVQAVLKVAASLSQVVRALLVTVETFTSGQALVVSREDRSLLWQKPGRRQAVGQYQYEAQLPLELQAVAHFSSAAARLLLVPLAQLHSQAVQA